MENNMLATVSKWRKSLMGISALWIWAFHCYTKLFEGTFLGFFETQFVQTGFVGVDIFLLLSGMGLVRSIKKGVLKFYINRIKRVAVPYVVASIFLSICFFKWGFIQFVKHVFGYYFFTESMYDYRWFIPAILIFYLFFPIYWLLFEKSRSKLNFTISVLLVWLLISLFLRGLLRIDLFGMTNRIPIFVIGVYLGYVALEDDFEWKRSCYFLFGIMLVTGAYASYICINRDYYLIVPESDCFLPNVFIAISLTFLLSRIFEVVSSHKRKEKGKSVIHIVLGFFGTISLEFYCIQETFRALTYRFIPYMSEAVAKLIVFIITALVAYLIYAFSKLLIKPLELINKGK